jgi:hypothetical protein
MLQEGRVLLMFCALKKLISVGTASTGEGFISLELISTYRRIVLTSVLISLGKQEDFFFDGEKRGISSCLPK